MFDQNIGYISCTIGLGWALPYMKVVGNFPGIDSHFAIMLALSHLVPVILWIKVSLIFHQNISFDHFETFCPNFLLDFQSCWPSFSLFLVDFYDRIFLPNLRSDWVNFFFACWTPLPNIWWSTPQGLWAVIESNQGYIKWGAYITFMGSYLC